MPGLHFCKVLSVLSILLCLVSCTDEKPRLSPLKIVCLGDSITYGFRLPDPVHQSFPAQLIEYGHGSWEVFNCGVNGATVQTKGDLPITLQTAYQRALSVPSDIVILLLGTNDAKLCNFRSADEFVSDYIKLIQKLQTLPSHPHVIACSIPPIWGDYPNGLNTKREQTINYLIKKAVSQSEVDFLDIHTPLLKDQSFFVDGIHPNAQGAQEIATLVYEKIVNL